MRSAGRRPKEGHAKTSRLFLASLDNSSFCWLLLVLAGAAVIPTFVLSIVVAPVVHQSTPGDLAVYLKAAKLLHSGSDPYTTWLSSHTLDPTRRQGYIYPPFLAWLLSPISNLPSVLVLAGLFLIDLVALSVFWWLISVGLKVRGAQPVVLMVVASLAFFPVQENFKWGQVNLVILGLCSWWFVGWVDGLDAVGGVTLGLSIAVKLLQAPVLLLLALTERFRMLIVSLAMVSVTFLAASPGLLPEYVTQVLPKLNHSTGYISNLAPIGFVARLIRPESVFADVGDVPAIAQATALLLSVAVALISAIVILRSRALDTSRSVRALQAACVLALCPLISTIDWPAHMALQLIPMAILLDWSLRRKHSTIAVGVLITWLLLGPAQQILWAVADDPAPARAFVFAIFWLLSQAGSVAVLVLWGAATLALLEECRIELEFETPAR